MTSDVATEALRWRKARFRTDEQRQEFLLHARELLAEDLQIEPHEAELAVLFRAPAKLELGLAGMVSAHGGTLIPMS